MGSCDAADRVLQWTPEYAEVRELAWVAIVLFPIGVPLLYGALLLRDRHELMQGEGVWQEKDLARALSFLHSEYEPAWFWWELVEVAKKLLLTGFFTLEVFRPGTITQLVGALLVSLCFLMLQMGWQRAPSTKKITFFANKQ